MNQEKVKAIPYSEKRCYCCLAEKESVHIFSVAGRGYGSDFDGCWNQFQVCSTCYSASELNQVSEWFSEQPTQDDYCETYQQESNIRRLVTGLPIQAREWFENSTAGDWVCDPQDWIDMKLGIAGDEVYKRNHRYSPSEIKAYQNRFPICQNVYLKTYADGSGGTRCDRGAFGNSDGTVGLNICDKCYQCPSFEPRPEGIQRSEQRVLTVKPKALKMYEIECPTCQRTQLIAAHKLECDGEEVEFCLCGQELALDIEDVYLTTTREMSQTTHYRVSVLDEAGYPRQFDLNESDFSDLRVYEDIVDQVSLIQSVQRIKETMVQEIWELEPESLLKLFKLDKQA